MTSQSISNSSNNNGSMVCECNLRASVFTARTPHNNGRRFMKCPQKYCKYFQWVDPPLQTNSTNSNEKLEEKIKEMQASIKAKDKQLSYMWGLIFVLIVDMLCSKWFK